MNAPRPSDLAPKSQSASNDGEFEAAQPLFGLSPGDRSFLLSLGILVLAILGLQQLLRLATPARRIEVVSPANAPAFQLDVNTATWVEWMQLEGIGETTARNIVADRSERGPFHSINDVQRVRGIGPATLAKIRPSLTCADCNAEAPAGPASKSSD